MMPGTVWLLALLAVTAQAQLLFESSEGDTLERLGCRDWSILTDSELTKELSKGEIIGDFGHSICATNISNLRRECKNYEHCIGCNYKFQYLGHKNPKQNFYFESTGEQEEGCPYRFLTGTGEEVSTTDILQFLREGGGGCNCRVPGV